MYMTNKCKYNANENVSCLKVKKRKTVIKFDFYVNLYLIFIPGI